MVGRLGLKPAHAHAQGRQGPRGGLSAFELDAAGAGCAALSFHEGGGISLRLDKPF